MSPLNPGIRETVAFLRQKGFNTTDSGDGVTHDFGCDRDYAYVCMTVSPADSLVAEADRLLGILRCRHGQKLVDCYDCTRWARWQEDDRERREKARIRAEASADLLSAALALEPHLTPTGHLTKGSGAARESFAALFTSIQAYRKAVGE